MRMAVAMAVEMAREASEAAIGHTVAGDVRPSVEAARHLTNKAGAAVMSIDKARRHGADGPAAHHGQDDAARTFHVTALGDTMQGLAI